ncbi:hypothetical protein [Pendulispora albinea]|uniref:Lipoprotein n=1 Tax=Pendulispora albinea TaxID=2741071 RepID=A0ABZ2LTV7_9BACT
MMNAMTNYARGLCAALLVASLAACSSDDDKGGGSGGKGTVTFTTFGEDYIEEQIPAEKFADLWTIRYKKFLVVFRDIRVARKGSAPVAQMAGSKLFDMTRPGQKFIVQFPNVPANAYDHVSYEIGPIAEDTVIEGPATDADRAIMLAGGYSVYVDAEATKGSVTKKYTWGFKTRTLYDECKGSVAGKEVEGVNVTNGGSDAPDLTIHGDHLYYDDLQDKEAKLRFDHIAGADKNNDGTVTLEELSAVKLVDIPKTEGPYRTGSAAGINDLAAFVTALSRTVGHYRGEGECFSKER